MNCFYLYVESWEDAQAYPNLYFSESLGFKELKKKIFFSQDHHGAEQGPPLEKRTKSEKNACGLNRIFPQYSGGHEKKKNFF